MIRALTVTTIAVAVLLVVGVPWNARDFEEPPFNGAYMAHTRAMLTNVLRLPEADEVSAAARPLFTLTSPERMMRYTCVLGTPLSWRIKKLSSRCPADSSSTGKKPSDSWARKAAFMRRRFS